VERIGRKEGRKEEGTRMSITINAKMYGWAELRECVYVTGKNGSGDEGEGGGFVSINTVVLLQG